MALRPHPPDLDCQFRDQAAAVLQRLRGALAAVVAAIPPAGSLANAAGLQRALKIDRKLSWKVFKVIRAGEPLSAGPHVPGPANLADFLRAAAKHGVPSDLIAAAASAGEDFQRVVEAHAGDRTTFDSMIDGLTEPESDQINLQHKRSAFRANRHIWGVQAQTHLYSVIVQPSHDDPERVSIAVIQGYRDLQRLRPGGSLVIGRVSLTDDQGKVFEVNRRPLDPGVSTSSGIALIRDFCSQPVPELRTVKTPTGIVYCELKSNGLGKRSAVTLVHGYSMCPTLPRRRAPGNEMFGTTVRVQFPCEVLVSDLLVRRDTWGPLRPPLASTACARPKPPGRLCRTNATSSRCVNP